MKALKSIEHFFPGQAEMIEIVRMPKPGASGPTVVIFTNNGSGRELAIKFGASRIPIKEQLANRATLAPYFEHRLVPIIGSRTDCHEDDSAILMPAYLCNFHEAVVEEQMFDDDRVLDIWRTILAEFTGLWRSTQIQWEPSLGVRLMRKPDARTEKIAVSVGAYVPPAFDHPLADFLELPVVVDDIVYPSLAQTFEQIRVAYRPPTVAVYCHGDVNANNVMVDKEGEWAMADWEWCGLHDWRLSASHLIGWWLSNAAIQQSRPTANVFESRLVLDYQSRLNPIVQQMVKTAGQAVNQFALSVNEAEFEKQWRLMLTVLLFGEVRFIALRKLCPEIGIYLIGEAMRMWWGSNPTTVL